jgi:putative drug exporter of the RND superfamily
MFRRLGILAARYPLQILIAWVVLLAAVIVALPKLGDVVSSSQASYLPNSSNVQQARAILKQAFPTSYSGSTTLLVLTGPPAARQAAVADYASFAAHRLTPAPNSVASDSLNPALHNSLNSRDGKVTLISLGWSQLDTSSIPGTSLTNLRAYITAHPHAGVTAQATGDVAINNDFQNQINSSTELASIVTVILVLAILLIVFRSPILPIVPLVTIGVALPISMGVVAVLGSHGMVISSNTPIFMIVLLVGAGTDYCLFLANRYREQLRAGMQPAEAIEVTMTHTGAAIASSGAAVIVGMAGMGFADFGLFNTTGPAVAVSVAITLLAGLTIAPALMRLLGRRTFWPVQMTTARRSRVWGTLASQVTSHPATALVAVLVLLLPLNLAVLKTGQNFNFLGDLGNSVEAHSGFNTVATHFGTGNALPNTLVIRAPAGLRDAAGLARLDALDARLALMAGVSGVQGPTRPGGQVIAYQAFAASPRVAAALALNLSADGRVARFNLTTSLDPYGQPAQDLLKTVRATAQAAFPSAQVQTQGTSPAITDIHDVMNGDMVRISLFVLGGIFLVLVLLLRALVAPVYLLATVLLSLGGTIGATTLVFQGIGGHDGLVFWVPILILTMLIGLSTDYNILLISRVREEARRGGDYRLAVSTALERTGGIITTCGLILAGSFGTLMLASITGLREMGFAITFGVLVDTFLLRSVLVPALVMLVGKLSWYPGRLAAPPVPVPANMPAVSERRRAS